jgi:small subunit ribosomal protein S16
VAAVDSRSPRDGRVIEELGSYNPLASDPKQQVVLNKDRIEYWLSVGAQPSDTVRSLLKRQGVNC